MVIVAPTVTAFEPHAYREQMEQIKPFANRVHIDLMDGVFAPTTSVRPDQLWWPESMEADIHVMYQQPQSILNGLMQLKPSLVIIHAEADADHHAVAAQLHAHDIKAGLALLPETSVEAIQELLPSFDNALIFGGHLGYHGGVADLAQLIKANQLRQLQPAIEISWDGGINDKNATELVAGGIGVLNVGGFIQNDPRPREKYQLILDAANPQPR